MLPAAFTRQQALAVGLSQALLRRLTTDGMVTRLDHGIYLGPDAQFVNQDLIEAALRAPLGTICLTSALAHHNLIDEIPVALDLALTRGSYLPALAAPVAWHQFDPSTFRIGLEVQHVARGISINTYNAERSVVDSFNPRLGVPREQAVEALRAWLRRPGSQPIDLLKIAENWPHAVTSLTRTLQVLL